MIIHLYFNVEQEAVRWTNAIISFGDESVKSSIDKGVFVTGKLEKLWCKY